jgi:hypothetical protein
MSRPLVEQFAGFYRRSLRWSPVPLRPKTKVCHFKGWPRFEFAETDFKPHDNIGLKSVGGLVITDEDCAEVVQAADTFLPPTGAIYGRPTKPRSKRLYFCPELDKPMQFTDVDGAMLLELRVNSQDMAPPSVHPNGEQLKWCGPLLEPAHVARDVLVDAHRHLAIAALIARNWPAKSRHFLRLAYARVLLDTLDIPDKDAVTILEAGCRVGGSDDAGVADAQRAIETTRMRLDVGEAATGVAGVASLIQEGQQIVNKLRRWLDKRDEVQEEIARLNASYAIIGVGNKTLVMETLLDGGIKELWPFEEFKRRLIKMHVKVRKNAGRAQASFKLAPLADLWLKHPEGRQFDQLRYAMPGSVVKCDPDDYNGYLGFTVAPQAGDWSLNRRHILDIICGANEGYYKWVINWCAALVQLPGRHAMTAIVLRGRQGVGKGHFANAMLGSLFFPQQYLHIMGANQLTAEFNEHLSGKVLVFADESTWGGDPKAGAKLKGLVTEDTVPIHRKFLKMIDEPSALHIIVASNNEWPVPIELDDRRFTVLDVSDARRQDNTYFSRLARELRSGGRAAMLHELLEHGVDEGALRRPLDTKAKREITALTLSPIQHWWLEKLKTGSMNDTDDRNAWPASIQKAAVHESFREFLDRHHQGNRDKRATETELGQFLQKYTPLTPQRRLVDGKRERFWNFPTLEACRSAWLKAFDWPVNYSWDGE